MLKTRYRALLKFKPFTEVNMLVLYIVKWNYNRRKIEIYLQLKYNDFLDELKQIRNFKARNNSKMNWRKKNWMLDRKLLFNKLFQSKRKKVI